jgi:O-antigen ligase
LAHSRLSILTFALLHLLFFNEARNDYLQLLVETGLAGFSIALWFLILVFRKAAGRIKNLDRDRYGCLTVAALLGCIGILAHSLPDFNLQIPANVRCFSFFALSPLARRCRNPSAA